MEIYINVGINNKDFKSCMKIPLTIRKSFENSIFIINDLWTIQTKI